MSLSPITRAPNPKSDKLNIKNVDLDMVFKEIGQTGPYQIGVLVLLCVFAIFRGWCFSEYVFTTAKINTRCYVEGCDTDGIEFTPEWVWSAVPGAGGTPDGCQRYANISALPADGSCPAHLFNSSLLQACDSYVYENTNTVTYDFDLACDEWRRSFIGSVRVMGMFVALPLTGYISDRWGRRTAIAFNSINAAWLGIIRYWASSYTVFVLSVFLESSFAAGIYTSIYVMATETMGKEYRVKGAGLIKTFVGFGQLSLPLFAWIFPYWRHLTLVLYAPQFLSIIAILFLNESVRWTLSKRRFVEAETLLHKIAKVNSKDISSETLKSLRRTYEEEKLIKPENNEQKEQRFIYYILNNKIMLLRLFVGSVCWITTLLIHCGLTLSAMTISGNKYINFAASIAVEIPAYWIAIYLLDRTGRKPVLSGAFLTCATTQAIYIFVPKDKYALCMTVYLIGKFTSGIISLTTYLYTTELYPTLHRHRFLAFSAFMGRIGAVSGPLTPAFAAATFPEFPFVLFGSCALLAGLLTLLLPETRGTQLPDTLQEAARIGKDNE